MFHFWKENSSAISKLMITQFGITVFGILLHSAASVAQNKTLVTVFSIFSILFYLFLLYTAMWDIGVKDKLRIAGKRLKPRPLYGLYVSLCANVPNILLTVLSTLGYLCVDRTVTDAAGNFITPTWAINLYAISHMIGTYINAMYIGLTDTLNISTYPYTLALIILPSLLVCFAGYYLGTKERFPIVPEKNNKNNY